jgi:hypothetical protein
MNRLPLTYKPTKLRPVPDLPKRDLAYSVGVLGVGTNIAVIEGPFPNLVDALEVVPGTDRDYVITRHETDGFDTIIYAWNHANKCWYIQTDPDLED